jgi:hypothetical protein
VQERARLRRTSIRCALVPLSRPRSALLSAQVRCGPNGASSCDASASGSTGAPVKVGVTSHAIGGFAGCRAVGTQEAHLAGVCLVTVSGRLMEAGLGRGDGVAWSLLAHGSRLCLLQIITAWSLLAVRSSVGQGTGWMWSLVAPKPSSRIRRPNAVFSGAAWSLPAGRPAWSAYDKSSPDAVGGRTSGLECP